MRIVWFTWKDIKNPRAGGAERISDMLATGLVAAGHKVIMITSAFSGCEAEEVVNNYRVIRRGNALTVYFRAFLFYSLNLRNWPDIVIEEINTIPFFTQFYARVKRRFLFFHQLCREIWFYQMFPPISYLGYFLEYFYLRLLNKNQAIVVSQSTKDDLLNYGFEKNKIFISLNGIDVKKNIHTDKYPNPTIISLGEIRPMKRTLDQIKAFEIAREKLLNLRLIIIGGNNNAYGLKVIKYIGNSKFRQDILYKGYVEENEKWSIVARSHLIIATSVKEGWGLTITEAGALGVPAVVYDVDGLRDAVKNDKTGIVCKCNTPEDLAHNIINLLSDRVLYKRLSDGAFAFANSLTVARSCESFKRILFESDVLC